MTTMFDSGASRAHTAGRRSDTTGERSIPVDRDEALEQVFLWNHDRLVGFFFRRTDDRLVAEDLAQDVILRFVGALDRFDPTRPVWPYLATIANNVLIDHLRTDGRDVAVDPEDEFADEPTPGSELDDTVVLRSLLDRAMDRLPERQRIAVELRCERGWSVADAADFLGVNPGTFSQLLFRARRSLRETLDAAGARARGVVLPVYLGVRLGARSLTDRVREFVQPTMPLGEALAGVAVAATLGLTTVVALPAAEAEPRQQAPKVLELLRQDVAGSVPPPVVTQDQEVAVGARHTATSASTPAVEPAAEEVPPPSGSGATVIEAPNAVPNSNGNVTVDDDEEYFVVSRHIEAQTGVETVESDGDAVAIHCGTVEGEILCATKDS